MGNINERYRLCVPSSPMRIAPDHDAECSNECLFGEQVFLLSPDAQHTQNEAHSRLVSNTDGQPLPWVRVITQQDRYSGFLDRNHLQKIDNNNASATHWVRAVSTLVFAEASIKSQVLTRLPFLSQITTGDTAQPPFRSLDSGGFVWDQHLLPIESPIDITPLQLAHSHFVGAPYLWGGCTPQGVDCSGLVQALAKACGLDIPRDSGDQEKALSNNVAAGAQTSQDLVYWPGHTGILVDSDTVLHATAHSLSCVIEPLETVVERAGKISSIKRLFS